MKKYIYIVIACFFACSMNAQINSPTPQVVINEIGLGASPSENFIELIPLIDKLDLSGWQMDNYQDDNIQDVGYIEFSEDFPLLPVGTPIFIYNDDNSFESVDPNFNLILNQNGYFQIPFGSDLILKIPYDSSKGAASSRATNTGTWSDYLALNTNKSGLHLKNSEGLLTHQMTWGFPFQSGTNISAFIATSTLGAINASTESLSATSHCFTASSGYEAGYNLNQVTTTTPGRRNSTSNHSFVTSLQTGGNVAIPFNINCSLGNMSSENISNGRAIVQASGGVLPLSISINGPLGAPSPYIDQDERTIALATLSSGIYNVIVTDANGCEQTCSFNIPTGTDLPTDGSCGIDAIVIGRELTDDECGFEWTPKTGLDDPESNITSVTLQPGESRTYTFKTSDGKGNILSVETYTVSMDAEIQVSIDGPSKRYCGDDLSFEAIIANGDGIEYQWTIEPEMDASGLTSSSLNILAATVDEVPSIPNDQIKVTLNVSHPDGCEGKTTKFITILDDLNVEITGDTELCADESSILIASGGDTYLWNTGAITPSIEINTGGYYEVTAKKGGSCSSSVVVQVSQSDLPDGDQDGFCQDEDDDDNDVCRPVSMSLDVVGASNPCGGLNAQLDLTINGGMPPFKIKWTIGNGGLPEIINGVYSVSFSSPSDYWDLEVSDANECTVHTGGTIQYSNAPDSDGDGVCDDVDSCAPNNPNVAPRLPCSDGNPCTKNDTYNNDCHCVGTIIPACVKCEEGSPCDDNNDCTLFDHFDENCACLGTYIPNCVTDTPQGTDISSCIPAEAEQSVKDLQEYYAPDGTRVHLSGEDYPLNFYNDLSQYEGALQAYIKNDIVYKKYPKSENGPFYGYIAQADYLLPDLSVEAEVNLMTITSQSTSTSYSVIIDSQEDQCSVATHTFYGSYPDNNQIYATDSECSCDKDANNTEDTELDLTSNCFPTEARNILTDPTTGLNTSWLTFDGLDITLLPTDEPKEFLSKQNLATAFTLGALFSFERESKLFIATFSQEGRFIGYRDENNFADVVYADSGANTGANGISVIIDTEQDCKVSISGQLNVNIKDCDCASIKRSACLPKSANSIINHRYFYDPSGQPIGLLDKPGLIGLPATKDIPLEFLAETNNTNFQVGALSKFSRTGVVFKMAIKQNGDFLGYIPEGDDSTISGVKQPYEYIDELRGNGIQSQSLYVDVTRNGDNCKVATRASVNDNPMEILDGLIDCNCYDGPGDFDSDNLLGIITNCIPFEAQTEDINLTDGIDLPLGIQGHRYFYDITGVPIVLQPNDIPVRFIIGFDPGTGFIEGGLIEFIRNGVRYVPVFNKRQNSNKHVWLGYFPDGSLATAPGQNLDPTLLTTLNVLDEIRVHNSTANHIFVIPSEQDQTPCTLSIAQGDNVNHDQPVNYCLCEEVNFLKFVGTRLLSDSHEQPSWERVFLNWDETNAFNKYYVGLTITPSSGQSTVINPKMFKTEDLPVIIQGDKRLYQLNLSGAFSINIPKTAQIEYSISPVFNDSDDLGDALYEFKGQSGKFMYDYSQFNTIDKSIIVGDNTVIGTCYDCGLVDNTVTIEEVSPDNYSFEWDDGLYAQGCNVNCNSQSIVQPESSTTYTLIRTTDDVNLKKLTILNQNIKQSDFTLDELKDKANINVEVDPVPEPDYDIYFTGNLSGFSSVVNWNFSTTQKYYNADELTVPKSLNSNPDLQITLHVDAYDESLENLKWFIRDENDNDIPFDQLLCNGFLSGYEWCTPSSANNNCNREQGLCWDLLKLLFEDQNNKLVATFDINGESYEIGVFIKTRNFAIVNVIAKPDKNDTKRIANAFETLYYLDKESPYVINSYSLLGATLTVEESSESSTLQKDTKFEVVTSPEVTEVELVAMSGDPTLSWDYTVGAPEYPDDSEMDDKLQFNLDLKNKDFPTTYPDILSVLVGESINNTGRGVNVQWVDYIKEEYEFKEAIVNVLKVLGWINDINEILNEIPGVSNASPIDCNISLDYEIRDALDKVSYTKDLEEDELSRHVHKIKSIAVESKPIKLIDCEYGLKPSLTLFGQKFSLGKLVIQFDVGLSGSAQLSSIKRFEDNTVVSGGTLASNFGVDITLNGIFQAGPTQTSTDTNTGNETTIGVSVEGKISSEVRISLEYEEIPKDRLFLKGNWDPLTLNVKLEAQAGIFGGSYSHEEKVTFFDSLEEEWNIIKFN